VPFTSWGAVVGFDLYVVGLGTVVVVDDVFADGLVVDPEPSLVVPDPLPDAPSPFRSDVP
jgi:hypothetical protein